MATIPQISIQLVHIQGPLKGEIQTFNEAEIRIGRHPDCQVQFPKDLVTLSRHHARIEREGNRFKLIDMSTNGSYVNGQRVSEAYLKDGDVITFSEGGPKVSFLTQTGAQQPAAPSAQPAPPVQPARPSAPQAAAPEPLQPPRSAPTQKPAAAPSSQPTASSPAADPNVVIETVKVPLAIQYGPALKSFQTLPITIGKGPGCDFTINHPTLNEQHAQIFFAQDRYWIKDLTGSHCVSINGMPIQLQAPLEPDARVALSSGGPKFRFLGGGRLAEIEDEPAPAAAPAQPQQPPPVPPAGKESKQDQLSQKAGALFKKFFR